LKDILKAFVFAGCFLLLSVAAPAQEVIHALTGTVVSFDASAKTITMFMDNHSEGQFKDLTNPKTRIDFDKTIRAISTSVDSFDKKGAYAIIFYYGGGNGRTAVALRSLGAGPFAKDTGTIVKVEGRSSISIADGSGSIKPFNLTSDTVAETEFGAQVVPKYQPHKGDQVRVTSAIVNGNATALFINSLVAN
jgi:hypothetical protein